MWSWLRMGKSSDLQLVRIGVEWIASMVDEMVTFGSDSQLRAQLGTALNDSNAVSQSKFFDFYLRKPNYETKS